MGIHQPTTQVRGFRWSDAWRAHIRTPTDWCEQHLGSALAAITTALKRPPGPDWQQNLLSATQNHPVVQHAFAEAFAATGWNHALPERVVYPATNWPLYLRLYRTGYRDAFEVEFQNERELAALRTALSGEWKVEAQASAAAEIAEQLIGAGAITEMVPDPRRFEAPGVYRLQHAGALVVSAEAKILIDPVSQIHPTWDIRPECFPGIDAVLISHSHKDHFCLPTLLTFPRDTLFIVPRVARASMLCADMAGLLRAAGFTRVVEPAWWEDVQVKDQIVHVLPFYGEQPWLHAPPPSNDLRNQGNTYLIDFGPGTVWFLIDSGQEAGASMFDVAARLRQRFGPVDLVLSNIRTFPWHPGQINLSGMYLLCLEARDLADPGRWPRPVSMTLGPSGIARLLGLVEARIFLPYAHWWAEPGKPVVGNEAEELMTNAVRQSCDRMGIKTPVVEWNVLDGFLHGAGGWARLPAPGHALTQAAE